MTREPTTHYPGCWQWHHACAIAQVRELSARLLAALDNPNLCDDPVWQQETRVALAWLDDEERPPAVIVKPGQILAKEIDARGWDIRAAAIRFFYPISGVQAIIEGKIPITESIAENLERALGISAQFWLNLQANYDRRTKERHEQG